MTVPFREITCFLSLQLTIRERNSLEHNLFEDARYRVIEYAV
jgi:hypothetical protein